MSKNFATLFTKNIKSILMNDNRYKINENSYESWIKTIIIASGAICHCVYTVGTSTDDSFTIEKKYKMVRNGSTEFMVVDREGRHFNVNNSFWYWKWDSIEDWHKIKEGDTIHFKYYGWRVPCLGLFPNIYYSKK